MREAILRVESGGQLVWRRYLGLQRTLSATSACEVREVLEQVELAANEGLACVGWVAYEAASTLSPALVTYPPKPNLPLVHFGVYEGWMDSAELPIGNPGPKAPLNWLPDTEPEQHAAAIRRIRGLIAAGDTYQVNFTLRLHSEDRTLPADLFRNMSECRRTAFAAYLETSHLAICCASPELFFELEGNAIRTRPMKGTAPRGLDSREDAILAEALFNSVKDRAENLMILDMARNDLGKIANIGSVRVVEPFRIERFATLHQMTSTAEATTHASLAEIFRALFPAASMTGAPKRRTMEIIRELESSPRGIYSGCIGVVGPGRRARFGVAIRTAVLDKATGNWEYGVGGGIVWDSQPELELKETQTKAAVLISSLPDFRLIETLKWSRDEGYAMLEGHLARLLGSATYFDWPLREEMIRETLLAATAGFDAEEQVVRLAIDTAGKLEIAARPFVPWPVDRPLRVAVASQRLDADTLWTRHKTDRRDSYDWARTEHPDCDEVLLPNSRGELADGTISNVAVFIDGAWLTPPIGSGAIPGVLRSELIASGALSEAVIRLDRLSPETAVQFFNSVRGKSEPIPLKHVRDALPCTQHSA
ncbi:MAG: bifunctional anthranilate synthase component I family protein/class IV aminotransferase [Armatimonadetes bacterium]|nr:bifunctional anthranilate synthase component I family protein/class IV aminotransferase [Armatimonadota bacterium]